MRVWWRTFRRTERHVLLSVFIMVAIWTFFMFGLAHGEGHTHDGDVGQFYMTWRPPDTEGLGYRQGSCCGNADCRPILAMRKSSSNWAGGGNYQVQAYEPHELKLRWYHVPDRVWEDVQPDPRESPDERGHVCINGGRVICAVRAGGF